MCEIDFDEYATVWDERLVRARKAHRCYTCSAAIAPGESYMVHFSVCSGDANHEKQCLRCRTISNAFTREHRTSLTPGSLMDYLVECLDEERWADDDDDCDEEDEDRLVPRNRLPSRLSDTGLRWKHAMREINARREEAAR